MILRECCHYINKKKLVRADYLDLVAMPKVTNRKHFIHINNIYVLRIYFKYGTILSFVKESKKRRRKEHSEIITKLMPSMTIWKFKGIYNNSLKE